MTNEGMEFIKVSSYTKAGGSGAIDEGKAPDREVLSKITLPEHKQDSELAKLIAKRRSKRLFDDRAITMQTLSYLLWSVQGVTGERGAMKMRAVASAGNRHCFNTYIVANKVDGLKQGLYLYNPEANSLGLIRSGDLSTEILAASFNQKMTADCSVCFIWTAVTPRMTSTYGLRGYRYMFLDAGHVGGQLQLACEDVGLGSCNVAAYMDDLVTEFLGITSELEFPIYMAPVGWPK